MGREGGDPNRGNPNRASQGKEEEEMKLWGVLVFGLIGATATTLAVSRLRQTVNWVYAQLTRSHESAKSFRTAFQEDAWKRYNRRMQEAYEEEMERVERIKRMQSVFNRERSKYNRGYQSWNENDAGAYNQQFQRDDWYWKADTSSRYQSTNFRRAPRENANYPLSHHYSVLGLDRSRKTPYTDSEIKTAFRAKALEFHPDQNQNNKVAAEAKFKEVMVSYEAIKKERENTRT